MGDLEYIIYYLGEDGEPDEWCASSASFDDAIHYMSIYSQDGPVGLMSQKNPEKVTVDGVWVTIGGGRA